MLKERAIVYVDESVRKTQAELCALKEGGPYTYHCPLNEYCPVSKYV
jgi:hypothetical protein